jgi:hypothetical protein
MEYTLPSKTNSNKSQEHGASAPGDVDAFLKSIDHPFEKEILALRQIILGAAPGIGEGIKWNAPSFQTSEYFATFHLRAKDCVQLILHLGAKKRESQLWEIRSMTPNRCLNGLLTTGRR